KLSNNMVPMPVACRSAKLEIALVDVIASVAVTLASVSLAGFSQRVLCPVSRTYRITTEYEVFVARSTANCPVLADAAVVLPMPNRNLFAEAFRVLAQTRHLKGLKLKCAK